MKQDVCGFLQSHALSFYMLLTSVNTRLQLPVDKLYGILYGKQKREVLCCVHKKRNSGFSQEDGYDLSR